MTRTMVKESLVVCTLPSGYSRCHFTPSNTTINLINLLAETPIYREIVSVVISTGKQTNKSTGTAPTSSPQTPKAFQVAGTETSSKKSRRT